MPDSEPLQRLLVDATVLRLIVDHYVSHDDMHVDDYPGPRLVATVFAGRAAALCPAGHAVEAIERSTARELHRLARLARDEQVRTGADTAVARPLTRLTLHLEHARGRADSFTADATINHLVPHALPPQWSALLYALRDQFALQSGPLADAWDLAVTWCAPVDLGASFAAGAAVTLPHAVTAFTHTGDLYLRTGQPIPDGPPGSFRAAPTSLYRFASGTLTCLDNGRLVAPLATHPAHWRLPCGGGTVTVHDEWQQPPRIVIRRDDARGIYVQRA